MIEPQLKSWMCSSRSPLSAIERLCSVFALAVLCSALGVSSVHARGRKPPPKSQYEIDLEKQSDQPGTNLEQPVEPAVNTPATKAPSAGETAPLSQQEAPTGEP